MQIMQGTGLYDVIIAGGGVAGLTSAIILARKKKKVLLIEKYAYPFHRVCGEYVSNEVLEHLRSLDFDPGTFGASSIKKLRISTPAGKNIFSPLELGGFGLSRFTMDKELFDIAVRSGAETLTDKISDIRFLENEFEVEVASGDVFHAKLVLGAYGKRDSLDKRLNRKFIEHHTGYLAVKYHVRTDYPKDEIGLDNFENGYCGLVKIEDDKYNLCYLYKRNENKKINNIKELEEKILFRNPALKNIFERSDFIGGAEVINEISFASKERVRDHIIMCGDSAGLITPLCGNGMAIAIHSSKLACELILETGILANHKISAHYRTNLEKLYEAKWQETFKSRLSWGRTIQRFFGNGTLTDLSLRAVHSLPPVKRWLIRKTHGTPVAVK
jgi:menaquinone-9 beta-reductase